MDVKQRQVHGLVRSLGISEQIAEGLVAVGLDTVSKVMAAPEGALLEHHVKTKVNEKIARVAALKGNLKIGR